MQHTWESEEIEYLGDAVDEARSVLQRSISLLRKEPGGFDPPRTVSGLRKASNGERLRQLEAEILAVPGLETAGDKMKAAAESDLFAILQNGKPLDRKATLRQARLNSKANSQAADVGAAAVDVMSHVTRTAELGDRASGFLGGTDPNVEAAVKSYQTLLGVELLHVSTACAALVLLLFVMCGICYHRLCYRIMLKRSRGKSTTTSKHMMTSSTISADASTFKWSRKSYCAFAFYGLGRVGAQCAT